MRVILDKCICSCSQPVEDMTSQKYTLTMDLEGEQLYAQIHSIKAFLKVKIKMRVVCETHFFIVPFAW